MTWLRYVLFAALFFAAPCDAQTVAPLDLASDLALARCAADKGLAGWLQRIDARGNYVEPATNQAYCVTPEPPQTWHLDLGLDAGKAFSIVDGRFVPSAVPSITLLFGPIEVSTAGYFYGTRFFEQDTHVRWYQRESDKRPWSLFGSLEHYKWPGGSSLHGRGGLRWRLR